MSAITAPQLLKLEDVEFDSRIKEMSVKNLLETITLLQREMSKEQENFNSLSAELGNLKKSSGQYKSISKDMTASQGRLTLLMNRSMKCFSQQGNQQSKGTTDKRSSLHDSSYKNPSQNRNSEPIKSATFNKPADKVKENNNVGNGNKPSVQSGTSSSPVLTTKSSISTNGFTGVNGSENKNQAIVNNSTEVNVVNSSYTENKSLKDKDVKTTSDSKTVTHGPIHDQSNKYTSKSLDNLSRPTTKAQQGEVVKGLQTKPASKVVLSADKQMIDLDSFTDRRNLLNELKKFDKELKPVANSKSDKITEVKLNLAKSGDKRASSTLEEKVPTSQVVEKTKLFGDIKQAKKPSEIKQNTIEPKSEPKTDSKIVEKTDNKIVTKAFNQGVSDKHVMFASKLESRSDEQTKQFDDILKDVYDTDSTNDESPIDSPRENMTNFSKPFNDKENNVKKSSDTDNKIGASAEVTITEVKYNTATESSEDSLSQSSELSEDEDKFVTEFHFTGSQILAPVKNTTKPLKQATTSTKQAPEKVKPDVKPKIQQQPVPVTSSSNHGNQSSTTTTTNITSSTNDDNDEELVKDTRVKFKDWDPAKLLAKLYEVKMMPDNIEDISHKFIGMEGLMEKLPMNKKKATLLKTWKRRFFRATDGWLHYYESGNKDKPSDSLQLMGGKVEELGPRVLGVDDGRGKYLMVRVPTDIEYGQWKIALESQTADNVKATYVRPAPASIPHPKKKVIIIDIGSSAIRAGILGERATLPQVFFPSIVAIHKQTREIIVGPDALKPDVRKVSTVLEPIQPTHKIDKFDIDMTVMKEIFKKVFKDLKVDQSQYLVMLSTPQNLGDKLRGNLMRVLVDDLHVRGVCMVQQALLSLYSYNAMSGIIVDIGERLEIMPIYDGLLIDHGVSRQAYGGKKIQDSLYISLLENRYEFNSPVEKYLVRYLAEQGCYITDNYKENKEKCDKDSTSYKRIVDLQQFDLPVGAHQQVTLDYACFKSPEGFFNTDLWEMDYKNLQKQIYAAIQQCPIDSRKQMYRSVYLSGGVTTIPGFSERLEVELRKLAPPAAIVEVHASPQRYHSAYIGACSVAGMDIFEMSCVSADEWKKMGVAACKKWGTG
ncbi:hypothetical protein ACF0H5_014497 [Mactra antiquata]